MPQTRDMPTTQSPAPALPVYLQVTLRIIRARATGGRATRAADAVWAGETTRPRLLRAQADLEALAAAGLIAPTTRDPFSYLPA